MDTQQARGIPHHLLMKAHHVSHKSHPDSLQESQVLESEDTALYFHRNNVLLVKPKGAANGNGDQGTLPKVLGVQC